MTKVMGRDAFADFSRAMDSPSEKGELVDNSRASMLSYGRPVVTSQLRRLGCWAGLHDWLPSPSFDDFGKVHLTRRLCLHCGNEDDLSSRFGLAGVCVTRTHYNRRAVTWLWNRNPVCRECAELVPATAISEGWGDS